MKLPSCFLLPPGVKQREPSCLYRTRSPSRCLIFEFSSRQFCLLLWLRSLSLAGSTIGGAVERDQSNGRNSVSLSETCRYDAAAVEQNRCEPLRALSSCKPHFPNFKEICRRPGDSSRLLSDLRSQRHFNFRFFTGNKIQPLQNFNNVAACVRQRAKPGEF